MCVGGKGDMGVGEGYFFQNVEVKSRRTVKTSRRPVSMMSDRTHLPSAGMMSY